LLPAVSFTFPARGVNGIYFLVFSFTFGQGVLIQKGSHTVILLLMTAGNLVFVQILIRQIECYKFALKEKADYK